MHTRQSLVSRDIFMERESAARSYCRAFPHILSTASGSLVRDTEGREFIDFLAGAGTLNYGHNDPDMKVALLAYIGRDGITHGLDLHTGAKHDFLTAFAEVILEPRGLPHRVQFTGPTGTNAVEAALKLARRVTGRTNVIAFTNAFHGVSTGALAATASQYHQMGPAQGLHGVTRMPFDQYLGDGTDTSELLARMLADPSGGVAAPAAILLELVQGEGGLNVASAGWFRRIAALAAEHGAVLIVDDCQAGCGRTGSFFSFEGTGVVPDLIVLAKSLSGMGLPMSAVLIRPELDQWRPGEHNGTFRGNAHAFVTAEVAVRKFWSDGHLARDIGRRATLVEAHLSEMAGMHPGLRRKGRGLMQGLDVLDGELSSAVRRTCIERGLLIEASGARDEIIKVMAPLTTPDDLLERGLGIVREALAEELIRWRVPELAG